MPSKPPTKACWRPLVSWLGRTPRSPAMSPATALKSARQLRPNDGAIAIANSRDSAPTALIEVQGFARALPLHNPGTRRGRAWRSPLFSASACKFIVPLQSIVLDCAFSIINFSEDDGFGQRHGSEADFLYQGCGKTPRAANFVRTGVARRRYRCPELSESLLDLSA